jgi:cellulose synthase operon protein YhjU
MDVIFIHVCSLAWDDLRAIEQERHPLFARFDVLFKRFNSVATYSGPAAIRLLRGACGQSEHRGLYDPAPAQCYVMNDLRQAGFEPQWLMNHDGRFADFSDDVRIRGGLSAPAQDHGGVPVAMHGFDGSAIYDDYAVLAQWWARRQASGVGHVSLYYNTISLHDGNRLVAGGGSSMSTYPHRTGKLLDDINRFVSLLESSGAHAIVVFVPEHGAAFRGDNGQVAGVREIPSERLTEIPVGVKFIGLPSHAATHPLNVDERMSYIGLNELIAGALANAGSAPTAAEQPLDLATLTAGLTGTPYVAENENLLVAEQDGQFFARDGSGNWLPAN